MAGDARATVVDAVSLRAAERVVEVQIERDAHLMSDEAKASVAIGTSWPNTTPSNIQRNKGLGAIEERVSPLDLAIKDATRVLGDEQAFVISIGSARAGGGLRE